MLYVQRSTYLVSCLESQRLLSATDQLCDLGAATSPLYVCFLLNRTSTMAASEMVKVKADESCAWDELCRFPIPTSALISQPPSRPSAVSDALGVHLGRSKGLWFLKPSSITLLTRTLKAQ